ncbi:LytR family transcriptional regulator [Cellulomonas shaoxiangyii]|uniref:LytR family transcriptional regulator n=2 Tax=Cellulomonas shaoxiangyii TaxID=2566013 RepID=A0A4P7SLU5_9CELL|nr:LytR family transcriptional regulator [Cellulomonas shaoxiangyii]TGY84811.1 LytR family transcriptional regulator [Cellulomonas shaoxiangyii]
MRGVALAATTVLVFGAAGGVAMAARLTGNVDQIDVADLVAAAPSPTEPADPADARAGEPVNVLVLGSDQRDGENGVIGGDEGGMRSDTTILLHVSADRTRVEMVSIPRDSLVEIPSCTMTDGSTTKPFDGMFNEAFATGWKTGQDVDSAAACAMSTVVHNTGVPLTHVVVVDFAGFQSMINAVGGVEMCIENDIKDRYTGLDITAGVHRLDGVTALQYARARHGTGLDGSDIKRAGRQQRLIANLANEVLSKNLLTDAPQLLQFLSAATQSLTTNISVSDLTGLAFSLRGIDRENIALTTVPWAPARSDANRVEWTPEADELWANIAADRPMLGAPTPDPTAAPQAGAADEPAATAPAGGGGVPPAVDPPVPAPTKTPGQEPFTAADVSSTC